MNLLHNFYQRVWDAVAKSSELDLPCVICETNTRDRDVHFRSDDERFPENAKRRVVVYPLCRQHGKDIEAMEKANRLVLGKPRLGWLYV